MVGMNTFVNDTYQRTLYHSKLLRSCQRSLEIDGDGGKSIFQSSANHLLIKKRLSNKKRMSSVTQAKLDSSPPEKRRQTSPSSITESIVDNRSSSKRNDKLLKIYDENTPIPEPFYVIDTNINNSFLYPPSQALSKEEDRYDSKLNDVISKKSEFSQVKQKKRFAFNEDTNISHCLHTNQSDLQELLNNQNITKTNNNTDDDLCNRSKIAEEALKCRSEELQNNSSFPSFRRRRNGRRRRRPNKNKKQSQIYSPFLSVVDANPSSEASDTTNLKSHCPLVECNGSGNFCHERSWHSSLQTCPLYHNDTETKSYLACSPSSKEGNDVEDGLFLKKYNQHILENKNLEPLLYCLAPKNELEMFLKAQKAALVENEDEFVPTSSYTDEVPNNTVYLNSSNISSTDTKVKRNTVLAKKRAKRLLEWIQFGAYKITPWFNDSSVFFEALKNQTNGIYICDSCLTTQPSLTSFKRHISHKKCSALPPGKEIYRDGNFVYFKVDGTFARTYCLSLCLIARAFIECKTQCTDVHLFFFYVLTECCKENLSSSASDAANFLQHRKCQTLGFFSKEKANLQNNTLACLLTLPNQMSKGYGKMLIGFSYALALLEGPVLSSPERPISDHGLMAYRNYWLCVFLLHVKNSILSPTSEKLGSTSERIYLSKVSRDTGIHMNDLVSTLQYYGLLKTWRGKLIILNKQLLEFWKKYSSKICNRDYMNPMKISKNIKLQGSS